MSPTRQPGDETPHVGKLRFGPALAAALYFLLLGSAALALAARRFPDAVPEAVAAAAPAVFLAFLVCFTGYRLVLVRARKYRAGKAFFQVGTGALFFMLLLPWSKPRDQVPTDSLEALLSDARPEVRALAAEAAGFRPDGARHASRLVASLGDSDETVRREAHRSLVKLTGADLGPPGDPAAVQAWKARYP